MERRAFLRHLGLGAAAAAAAARSTAAPGAGARPAEGAPPGAAPLAPPADGPVPVAFLLSEGAVVIDFCGPWEVFQDVDVPGRSAPAFEVYTVAESRQPIRASGGLTIVPDHDLATAPPPKVIVIPAQRGRSEAMVGWIRAAARGADLAMSVCTGAFLLARTGLLAGKAATTHHGALVELAMEYPDVKVTRGARFVDGGAVATAGGLSSGIDLALHVVERYYGREIARQTAFTMEYQGRGWLDPASGAEFARPPRAQPGHALCPVCWMEVDAAHAPRSTRGGETYFFCMPAHKQVFDAAPERFADPR